MDAPDEAKDLNMPEVNRTNLFEIQIFPIEKETKQKTLKVIR